MISRNSLLICFLVVLTILIAGCTDTINDTKPNQISTLICQVSNNTSTYHKSNTSSNQIFENIEYNMASDMRFRWLNSNYETVTPNISLFMESISENRINLTLMGEIVDLEIQEVPIPRGASMVSLNNGINLEISDSNDSIFQGRVFDVAKSSAWLMVSKKNGHIYGEISTGNKTYHIWNIDRQTNGKPVEIIHISEYQSGKLKLTAVPEKTELNNNELTTITLTLTNDGNTTLNVWKMEYPTSYYISFEPIKSARVIDKKCSSTDRPPLNDIFLVQLKPGKSINSTIDTGCWTLSPGDYEMIAVYNTENGEMFSKPYWRSEVKSNKVLIKVRES
jgi:hypothetical protein